MKKLLLLCALSVACNASFAQATDLVVDCQTPGWLSSKINYGDQQTVKNLKVTGYINETDLKFIGSLVSKRNLTGGLDLSECNIVGETSANNNVLGGLGASGNLRTYRIPKSAIEVNNCLSGLNVDSLWFDCDIKYVSQAMLGKMPTTLITGIKIDSIPNNAFFQYADNKNKVDGLESVILKGDIRYIGDRAFPYIKNINFYDFTNLRYLGRNAFSYSAPSEGDNLGYFKPDTIRVPKTLKETYYLFSFAGKDEQHVFIDDNIDNISGMSWKGLGGADSPHYNYAKLYFHFHKTTPPAIIDYPGFSSSAKGSKFETSIVYVPKGAKQAYLNSDWKNATIIEQSHIETITLNEHQIILNKEEQFPLSVSITPEDAEDKTIEWKSEDESIATVDANGVVTAIKEGETKIFATSTETGIQDLCMVLVRKNVTGISLEETQISLTKIGDTKQLVAAITPDDATDKSVTWKSSDEQVCTVSETGLVTATGVGTTMVTVMTADGGLTATCVVKVIQHVVDLSLNKTTLSLNVGESEKLQAIISPSNADNKNVTWISADENLATVDTEGNVTAIKAGDVIVTATSEDNAEAKATCKVTIIQPATGITLSETTYRMNAIGESVLLTATVLPNDATNKNVIWSSSAETVCVVSNGNVIAVGYGTSVVIAKTEDGGFLASCVISVESTSGITEMHNDENNGSPIYDMMGRRISNMKNGQIYIHKCKKIVIQ